MGQPPLTAFGLPHRARDEQRARGDRSGRNAFLGGTGLPPNVGRRWVDIAHEPQEAAGAAHRGRTSSGPSSKIDLRAGRLLVMDHLADGFLVPMLGSAVGAADGDVPWTEAPVAGPPPRISPVPRAAVPACSGATDLARVALHISLTRGLTELHTALRHFLLKEREPSPCTALGVSPREGCNAPEPSVPEAWRAPLFPRRACERGARRSDCAAHNVSATPARACR